MARTARQQAALRKAQLASAAKRRGRGRKRTVAKLVAAGAVTGAVVYSYHKSPTFRGHVKAGGRFAKHHGRAAAGFVGHMAASPAGAIAHAQALHGALHGKKSGRDFLHASYNWEKMRRQSGGRRMYTVG